MTIKRQLFLSGILGFALALGASVGHAQLGGLLKKKTAGGADLAGQQDKLMSGYSAAGELLSEALSLTLTALGAKGDADKLTAQMKELKGKNDKASAETIHKTLGGAAKQADELISKAGKLSEDQKKMVQKSLVPFGGGLAVDAGLVALAVETSKQAQGEVKSNPLAAAKFAPAIYMATILPGDVKLFGSTLGNYIKLAKDNGIEVPKDATDALGKL